MYLLDTMIVSELRKPRRHPGLVAWLQRVRPADCYLSVVTVGEIEKGISRQERHDPRFAGRLAMWLDTLLVRYAARILPVDVPIARRWGRLADAHGHAGADFLLAATALHHGLTGGHAQRPPLRRHRCGNLQPVSTLTRPDQRRG